ncbi:MAG: RNA polymerase sigma factor [Sphingomicrobium sp.]
MPDVRRHRIVVPTSARCLQREFLSAAAPDERERARRAAAGDLTAFGELVRTHEPRLRALLRRLAGDSGDDLAQEVFLAAWRSAAAWRGESAYFTWLARIAWRRFLSHRRSDRPHNALEDAPELAPCSNIDQRLAIEAALASLPQRERMAALLCYAFGYSHIEAAGIIEVPLGTLKSIVARAKQKLLASLEDEL